MRTSLATGLSLLALALCGCVVQVRDDWHRDAAPAMADVGGPMEVDAFYTALAPYGDWVDVPDHSLCWVPRGLAVGWQPYTRGHWVDSDYGLYWVSDYDWGWACFHYGRWFWTTGFGWCWKPGTVWGPNWCAWRWGDDWCAWAPLPLAAEFSLGVGLTIGDARLDLLIDPSWWCCCPRGYILAPGIHTYIAPFTRNVTILHVTKNVTKIVVRNRHAAYVGISRADLEHAVGRRVEPYRIRETHSASVAHRYRGGRDGDLPVFRPERTTGGPPGHARTAPHLMPPEEQRRRTQDYERAYGQFMESQRREMDRRHRDEDARRPPTMSREDLSRRHDEERQAFESHMRMQRQGPSDDGPGGRGREGAGEGRGRREGEGRDRGGDDDRGGRGGPR